MLGWVKDIVKKVPHIRRMIVDLEKTNALVSTLALQVEELQAQARNLENENGNLLSEGERLLFRINHLENDLQRTVDANAVVCGESHEERMPDAPLNIFPDGSMVIRCNLCGHRGIMDFGQAKREGLICERCFANSRHRSMVHVLSLRLFGVGLSVEDIPRRPDIRGLGLSDVEYYAAPLAQKFEYINTFYDREPRLDILSVPSEMENAFDFVISSDVFEHVPLPVESAFAGLYKLLKPGGCCVFSVPYESGVSTIEHFPNLHHYRIVEDGPTALVNTTVDGKEEVFTDLVFHAGEGSTLEMRRFGKDDLCKNIAAAGFTDIAFHHEPEFRFGIFFRPNEAVPMSFRKPGGEIRD